MKKNDSIKSSLDLCASTNNASLSVYFLMQSPDGSMSSKLVWIVALHQSDGTTIQYVR